MGNKEREFQLIADFSYEFKKKNLPLQLGEICIFIACCDQNRHRSEELLNGLIDIAKNCKGQEDFTKEMLKLFDIQEEE